LLRLLALILPLSLDTFAVSAAIGVAGTTAAERLRTSLVFAVFEGVMPLIGFLAGSALGGAIGARADYVAGALLIGLGSYMLCCEDDDEAEATSRMADAHGLTLITLGIGVSIDELAIGVSIGLLGIPILLAAILIGLQAFLVSQLGVRVGARVGENIREGAERMAGLSLLLLGVLPGS
jgi:manganese efflux pump family protein